MKRGSIEPEQSHVKRRSQQHGARRGQTGHGAVQKRSEHYGWEGLPGPPGKNVVQRQKRRVYGGGGGGNRAKALKKEAQ